MLEALGNLGDFIGGIAVIATLLYLAVQIRQNTRSLQSAAHDVAAEYVARTQLAIAQDAQLADLIERGSADYAALSAVDQRRFRAFVVQQLANGEARFSKYELRLLPRSDLEKYEGALRYAFGRPAYRQVWNEVGPMFSLEFREFVDRIIANRDESGPAVQQGAAADVTQRVSIDLGRLLASNLGASATVGGLCHAAERPIRWAAGRGRSASSERRRF